MKTHDLVLDIKNFQCFKELRVILPLNTSWTFFTGEPGSGKTSALQAIARALASPQQILLINSLLPQAENSRLNLKWDQQNSVNVNKAHILVIGYGAERQCLGADPWDIDTEHYPAKSLFQSAMLRSIDSEGLSRWYFQSFNQKVFEHAVSLIKLVLPRLDNISVTEASQVLYSFCDDEGAPLAPVPFAQLSTSQRHVIALVGDLFLNLFDSDKDCFTQQRDTSIGQSKRSIVLIDQPELYLSATQQRALPTQLSKCFPNIHFIVATNSNDVLVGAPAHSKTFWIERTGDKGAIITGSP